MNSSTLASESAPSVLPRGVEFVRAEDVVCAEIGTESILLDMRTGTYFSLNTTGQVLWQRLAAPAEFGPLCEAVAAGFDVVPATLADDVRNFLTQLIDRDLATMRNAAIQEVP